MERLYVTIPEFYRTEMNDDALLTCTVLKTSKAMKNIHNIETE